MEFNHGIFREYDIRGVADRDLTDAVLAPLSRALGTYYVGKGKKKISIGYDCRVSSPRIRDAFLTGFLDCGLNVRLIGEVPTPLLYFSVFKGKLDGGVMITGSHNPAEHNGFKMLCGDSTIHGEEIQKLKQIMMSGDFAKGKGSLEEYSVDEEYITHVLEGITHPVNVKVVMDNGNGSGGPIAKALYERMGCSLTSLYVKPDGTFPNHHPDPTVLENLEELIETVKKNGAQVGIGFDGDADRIGAVSGSGRPVFGDELLSVYAKDVLTNHPGASIISEVKASHRLFQSIEKNGGKPVMWKTGHSLIKAKMKELSSPLAGEMSGHMFFKDRYYGYDDAIYAGARLIEILHLTGKSLDELLSELPDTHTTAEIRVDCPDEIKFEVVAAATESLRDSGCDVKDIDGARVEFADGWGLVRASNTQPVLVYRFEASTEARLGEIRSLVESAVSDAISKRSKTA